MATKHRPWSFRKRVNTSRCRKRTCYSHRRLSTHVRGLAQHTTINGKWENENEKNTVVLLNVLGASTCEINATINSGVVWAGVSCSQEQCLHACPGLQQLEPGWSNSPGLQVAALGGRGAGRSWGAGPWLAGLGWLGVICVQQSPITCVFNHT